MPGLSTILGFLNPNNLKWISIILLTIVLAAGAVKLNSLIKANAENKLIISKLESDIRNKDVIIDLKNNVIVLSDEVIKARDETISELDAKLENINQDLPKDNVDLAPLSTQEFLRRLGEITQ